MPLHRPLVRTAVLSLTLVVGGCMTAAADDDDMATPEPLGDLLGSEQLESSDAAPEINLEWQKTLNKDVVEIQAAGDAFLEASFGLYDQLAHARQGPEVDRALVESTTRYVTLSRAVRKLKKDLDDPDIHGHLPVGSEGGRSELDMVQAVLAGFNAQFRLAAAGTRPKTEDAHALMEYLRQLASDLAALSSTVAAWVNDPSDVWSMVTVKP